MNEKTYSQKTYRRRHLKQYSSIHQRRQKVNKISIYEYTITLVYADKKNTSKTEQLSQFI